VSKTKEDSFGQVLAFASETKVNKFYKEVAVLVVANLKLRRVLAQLDNILDHMVEESDPSHPRHKDYLIGRKKLTVLEEKRHKLNVKLRIYGIDLR
jgi:hypothetical protein